MWKKKKKEKTELWKDSKHKEVLRFEQSLTKKRKETGRKKRKRRILTAEEECIYSRN